MIIVWQGKEKKQPVHLYGTPGVYDTFVTSITTASGPLLLFFNFQITRDLPSLAM